MNFWHKVIIITIGMAFCQWLQANGYIDFDPHTNPLAYFLKGTFWIFVVTFLVGGRIVAWIKDE